MSRAFSLLGILVLIAFRNLFANRAKTLIIGGIIFLGTVLVVVGSAMSDSVERSMSRSIIGSAAGHIQVYSAESKDPLAIWATFGQAADLVPLEDVTVLRTTLEPVENIKTIVPMAIKEAILPGGNTIDLTLTKLRDAVKARRDGGPSAPTPEHVEALKQHVRQIVRSLQTDVGNLKSLSGERTVETADVAAIERAGSDAFWSEFDADPYAALDFLENRIAPQIADADLLTMSYMGTDLGRFAESFDRFRIVDGEAVPEGRRGFLFSKHFYEENCKLRTARRLDKIHEAVTVGGKTIAGDLELQHLVRENVAQLRDLTYQMDPERTKLAVERLQAILGSKDTDVTPLLGQFLAVTDANIGERYKQFYDQLAPLLELYRIRIGDMLTIQAIGRSGYMRSANVKVYGTFEFEGLEKSALAGGINLTDLMTFRDLYGFLTADKAAEIEKIKKDARVKEIDRGSAEAELFGGGGEIVSTATSADIEELAKFDATKQQADLVERVYTVDEREHGVFLNAAITLKDPSRMDETIREIGDVANRAGLKLKVVSWQEAAGVLGQLTLVLRLVLFVAVLIIFSVALVIMSNATVMATLQRVGEIGTLRAMGGQKLFVVQMLLLEAIAVGLVFGALGALAGVALVRFAGSVGIPAVSEELYFFFSGPRFYPSIELTNVVIAFGVVLIVTLLSSMYPARLATKVSPLEAMQSTD